MIAKVRLPALHMVPLLVAVVQAVLYAVLLPPWQHYDEPTHFEYAWLIANRLRLPVPGEVDSEFRRAVALSMQEHGFYHGLPLPDFTQDPVPIGHSELHHPPAYYLLVSVPLRLVRAWSITAQLYVARGVSALLYVITIGLIGAVMRELTSPGSMLHWAIPVIAALFPPVAEALSGVNNDVGAVYAVTLWVWCVARFLCRPWRPVSAALVIGAALVGAATKGTALLPLVLTPCVLLLALPHRRIVLGLATLGLLGSLVACVRWDDAAGWYRVPSMPIASLSSQEQRLDALVGARVLRLETGGFRQMRAALDEATVVRVRGHMVTVGAWVWASRSVTVTAPGLVVEQGAEGTALPGVHVPLTEHPQLVMQHLVIPPDARAVWFAAFGNVQDRQAATVFLDAAFVVDALVPVGVVPEWRDGDAPSLRWNGEEATNLLRGGSVETAAPRLVPAVERVVVRVTRRAPSQVLAALLDTERTGTFLRTSAIDLARGWITGFAWGHIRPDPGWAWVPMGLVGAVSLLGATCWTIQHARGVRRDVVVLLGLVGMGIALVTLLRPLPLITPPYQYPAARYMFPALFPVALVLGGGWWVCWPRAWRAMALGAMISGMMVLNVSMAWDIHRAY